MKKRKQLRKLEQLMAATRISFRQISHQVVNVQYTFWIFHSLSLSSQEYFFSFSPQCRNSNFSLEYVYYFYANLKISIVLRFLFYWLKDICHNEFNNYFEKSFWLISLARVKLLKGVIKANILSITFCNRVNTEPVDLWSLLKV